MIPDICLHTAHQDVSGLCMAGKKLLSSSQNAGHLWGPGGEAVSAPVQPGQSKLGTGEERRGTDGNAADVGVSEGRLLLMSAFGDTCRVWHHLLTATQQAHKGYLQSCTLFGYSSAGLALEACCRDCCAYRNGEQIF